MFNYYTSILPIVLNKVLMFATTHSDLDRSEINTIITVRRTVIHYDNKLWNRNNRQNEFDITMGANDSAQISDLLGLYLVHKIGEEFPELGEGLYRDVALFTVTEHSNVKIEKVTKKIRKFFKTYGLEITTKNSPHTANFLDVTL